MALALQFGKQSNDSNYESLIYSYINNQEKVLEARHAIACALYYNNNIKTLDDFDSYRETLKEDYKRQFARTQLFRDFHVGSNCESISFTRDIEFVEEGERLLRRKNRGNYFSSSFKFKFNSYLTLYRCCKNSNTRTYRKDM